MGGVSIWHWIVVGIIVMVLFGRNKISDLMGDVAKGIKSFKQGMADDPVEAKPTEPPKPLTSNPVEDQRATAGVHATTTDHKTA
jgi:sec-independent protein translocase protein TatA